MAEPLTKFVAEVIKRIHGGQSVGELINE